jgi:hypothetical protein
MIVDRIASISTGPLRVQIIPPKQLNVPEGGTASWQCEIVGDRVYYPTFPVLVPSSQPAAVECVYVFGVVLQPPQYDLVWTKVGSAALPDNARQTNGRLTIQNVKEDDVGQYRCTVSGWYQWIYLNFR